MRKNGQTKTCAQCGVEFYAQASHVSQKYCSAECYNQSRNVTPEETKEWWAKWRIEHAVELKERDREYKRTHREQLNARSKRYRAEHPEYRKHRHDQQMAERRDKKQALVDLFGGACQRCGYSKMQAALEFHHINAQSKKEKPAALVGQGTTEYALVELDKCALLCANCHAGLHHGEFEPVWVKRDGWGWTIEQDQQEDEARWHE